MVGPPLRTSSPNQPTLLGQSDVQVWSYQEPWTEAGGELLDLLLAIAGWVARMESYPQSERTRAGMAGAKPGQAAG